MGLQTLIYKMQSKTTTPRALLTVVSEGANCRHCREKISVIGAGSVGTAIAFTLLAQKICSDLVLIDKNEELARGEMLDIQHATMYLDSPQISSST
ncbi:PREDICTED: L-lactate dehydrogenase A chain-like, partial [Nicrophorus vespilloides]|uniref:L-lactate dehydrogenase A chain-like n=1 Tax=Nicrophorus vespilloides TaxID=110193 RepID=A0ABM1MMW4_NICVS